MNKTVITYGVSYNDDLNTFTGGNWNRTHRAKLIKNNVYLRPYSNTYRLTDGRILHVVNSVEGDTCYLFETSDEFHTFEKREQDAFFEAGGMKWK